MKSNWYKTAQEIFRGDTQPIDIEDFDPDHNKEYRGGPGIYFSTKEENAKTFGDNLTKKTLENANILTANHRPLSRGKISKILSSVDKETLELAASNFDENFQQGKAILIQEIVNNPNPIEQLMSIWADVFNHRDAALFMALMVKNGIDGIAIDRPDKIDSSKDDMHYVIYNKNVLK